MLFHRHEKRETFTAINIVIIAFEVFAALSLLFGLIGALALMVSQTGTVPTREDLMLFVLVGFGGMALSFAFLGAAEFFQLLLKIEHNTRKR